MCEPLICEVRVLMLISVMTVIIWNKHYLVQVRMRDSTVLSYFVCVTLKSAEARLKQLPRVLHSVFLVHLCFIFCFARFNFIRFLISSV